MHLVGFHCTSILNYRQTEEAMYLEYREADMKLE